MKIINYFEKSELRLYLSLDQ